MFKALGSICSRGRERKEKEEERRQGEARQEEGVALRPSFSPERQLLLALGKSLSSQRKPSWVPTSL